MHKQQLISILRKLFVLEKFSLANYMWHARPRIMPDHESLHTAIRQIGDQQRRFAHRIGLMILAHHGDTRESGFPLQFTIFNDLPLDIFARQVMQDQARILSEVEAYAHQLAGAPGAHSLALQILRAEQKHFNRLADMPGRDAKDAMHPGAADTERAPARSKSPADVTAA